MQIYTECEALSALFLWGLQNNIFSSNKKTLEFVIWLVFSYCFSFGPKNPLITGIIVCVNL